MTCNRNDDDDDLTDFAGIANIFGSSSVLIYIVFSLRTEVLTVTLILFLTLLLLFILFPSRKTLEILNDSKSSKSIKSALNPGSIAPWSINPKYLAVLIDAI